MQALTTPPQSVSPYTAAGAYNAPKLGTPLPGTTGGLPALSGLSANTNPLAQELQSYGRGDDSVLVHMTPNEVNSLQGLAMASGGSLTINPHTGLPEAGWLGKLLPSLLGFALNFIPGVGPLLAAGITAAGTTAVTGDLGKGLMAGLGAFGGASLGGAAGLGLDAAKTGITTAAANVGSGIAGAATNAAPSLALEGVNQAAINAAGSGIAGAAGSTASPAMSLGIDSLVGQGVRSAGSGIAGAAGSAVTPAMGLGADTLVRGGIGAAQAGAGAAPQGILGKFSAAAREGLKPGTLPFKAAPYAAGAGILNAVGEATRPKLKKYEEEEDKWNYEGPYKPQPRKLRPTVSGEGELNYFEPSNPYPGYLTASGGIPQGFAEGGEADEPKRGLYVTSAPPPAAPSAPPPNAGSLDYNKAMQAFAAAAAGLDSSAPGGLGALGVPMDQFQSHQATLRNLQTNNASTQAQHEAALANAMSFLNQYRPNTGGGAGGGGSNPNAPVVFGPDTIAQAPAIRNPQAGPSGAQVTALENMYMPQFSQRSNYTSPFIPNAAAGRNTASMVPQFVSQFQSASPGPVTASLGYQGGSPSERIRAAAQANAANTAGEQDYGFAKAALNPDGTDTPPTNTYDSYDPLAFLSGFGAIPYADTYSTSTVTNKGNKKAKGGEVSMRDGSFVVDARTVSELGNGSSNAGIEILQRLGGQAVRGPGDGVSDSVPARIGGRQKARVARDEVIFSPEAVRRLGGAKKLYALMDKAHKARKKAKRGQNTKVARGLGALA